MTPQQRIRLARRHAGLSQASLGAAVGVQRSAVGHWEAARGKFPSVAHLREIALVTGVQFEWLATGRGSMGLSPDTACAVVENASLAGRRRFHGTLADLPSLGDRHDLDGPVMTIIGDAVAGADLGLSEPLAAHRKHVAAEGMAA